MKIIKALLISLLLVFVSQSVLDTAQARPGGGHSSSSNSSSRGGGGGGGYSRGGGGYSRGGGGGYSGGYYGGGSTWDNSSYGNTYVVTDGGAELFFMILILVIVMIVFLNMRRSREPRTVYSAPTEIVRSWSDSEVSRAIARLKEEDPNFSKILLMDFVHLLYTKFYSYSGKPEFSHLTPFLSPELQVQGKLAMPGQEIDEVVINGIEWQEVELDQPQQDGIVLQMDANYTQRLQGKNTRYIITERWKLIRQKGVLSLEPQKMQALSCPFCAAPAHFNDAGVCPYCKNQLQQGTEQWFVKQRVVVQISVLAAGDLVTYAEEEGTEFETIKAADLPQQLAHFQQLHDIQDIGEFWQDFKTRIVASYFLEIYQHWSSRDWDSIRHLVSDRLFEANQFWIDRYRQQNWFNRLEAIQIERVELSKVELDRFYEALTVRIFASCYDYTEDAQGKLIGGSKRQRRYYSEYWTFVRRMGVETPQAPFSLKQCPHCGAPADKMGQSAVCGYCGSKISTGEFSWVLFLIMQDDVYSG